MTELEAQKNQQTAAQALTAVTARNNEPIFWPSERIAPGGLFHTPIFEYSKETADLLKTLMEETKMSIMMRKQIGYALRSGEPLSRPNKSRPLQVDPDREALDILARARNAKRKSLEKILASGALNMPRYRPRPDDKTPSEKAKKQLQEAMSGLRLSETQLKPKRRPPTNNEKHATTPDLIDELLEQINERANWLAEMEELGEGKKYRDEVRDQIAQRLRHIKALEVKLKLQEEGVRYVD